MGYTVLHERSHLAWKESEIIISVSFKRTIKTFYPTDSTGRHRWDQYEWIHWVLRPFSYKPKPIPYLTRSSHCCPSSLNDDCDPHLWSWLYCWGSTSINNAMKTYDTLTLDKINVYLLNPDFFSFEVFVQKSWNVGWASRGSWPSG